MCVKERHTERKRQQKWHLGKLERGYGKEWKDERLEKVLRGKRIREPQQARIRENDKRDASFQRTQFYLFLFLFHPAC